VLVYHGSFGHFRGGFLGVDIFFVLSGFLITGLLQSELQTSGRVDWARFYVRRAGRLLPGLFALLVVTGALWPYLRAEFPFRSILAPVLLYYANWTTAYSGWLGPLAHVWSLSVEEQFYLLWPLCFALFFYRRSPARVVAVIMICAAARAVLHAYSSPLGDYVSTISRADELLVGALAAQVAANVPARLSRAVAGITAALLIASFGLVDYHDAWLYNGGYTVLALLFAGTILHLADDRASSVLKWALERGPLVFVGKISYGLYLYHFPIFRLLQPLGRPHSVVSRLLVLALQLSVTFVVAVISYRVIERPILGWVRRLHAGAVENVAARDLQPSPQL